MKNMIKAEELGMFLLSIYAFSLLDHAWWLFLVLILTPDIGMLGYLVNTKVGAVTYNITHHKGLAILTFSLGIYLQIPVLELIGVIMFGHSSLDRLVGYGLKYSDDFKHTSLGMVGQKDK